jgi:hypothetical protein
MYDHVRVGVAAIAHRVHPVTVWCVLVVYQYAPLGALAHRDALCVTQTACRHRDRPIPAGGFMMFLQQWRGAGSSAGSRA